MDINFTTENLGNAGLLMLLGMVGIFVVMAIILGVVVLLNKTTDEKFIAKRKARKAEKRAQKAAKKVV